MERQGTTLSSITLFETARFEPLSRSAVGFCAMEKLSRPLPGCGDGLSARSGLPRALVLASIVRGGGIADRGVGVRSQCV